MNFVVVLNLGNSKISWKFETLGYLQERLGGGGVVVVGWWGLRDGGMVGWWWRVLLVVIRTGGGLHGVPRISKLTKNVCYVALHIARARPSLKTQNASRAL